MSRIRKFFGSAKSATRSLAIGFIVPGLGYLEKFVNYNIVMFLILMFPI